ncbi:hypothetical protein [Colwellia psychrerythraea]|uniref:Outer membrane protein beta-barrel domain-containing protein n=1 Tax=Colwellia psychrerythraea TaxID=28229 RepID=A0A099KK54_COLPS|nr:hypothetical protein [Colwellia psychrerythraea]KGJ91179.1 hypothetical protein GAB14E_3331 [Colwellia psychrerythraea]
MNKQQTAIKLSPLTLTPLAFAITLGLTIANPSAVQAKTYQLQSASNKNLSMDDFSYQEKFSWSIFAGVTNGGDTIALGDTEVTYSRDGEQVTGVSYSEKLKTGGFAVLGLGANYIIDERFSIQLNGAYHWDRISDPDIKFTRLELELIPYYQLTDTLQLGLGLVSHLNIKLDEQSTPLLVKSARSEEDTELRVFNEFPEMLMPQAQGLIDGQTRTDDDLVINTQADFSTATGYLASLVYQLPQWHSKVEFRAVFIDYKADVTSNITNPQQVLDTNTGEVAFDARHAGIYWHFVF